MATANQLDALQKRFDATKKKYLSDGKLNEHEKLVLKNFETRINKLRSNIRSAGGASGAAGKSETKSPGEIMGPPAPPTGSPKNKSSRAPGNIMGPPAPSTSAKNKLKSKASSEIMGPPAPSTSGTNNNADLESLFDPSMYSFPLPQNTNLLGQEPQDGNAMSPGNLGRAEREANSKIMAMAEKLDSSVLGRLWQAAVGGMNPEIMAAMNYGTQVDIAKLQLGVSMLKKNYYTRSQRGLKDAKEGYAIAKTQDQVKLLDSEGPIRLKSHIMWADKFAAKLLAKDAQNMAGGELNRTTRAFVLEGGSAHALSCLMSKAKQTLQQNDQAAMVAFWEKHKPVIVKSLETVVDVSIYTTTVLAFLATGGLAGAGAAVMGAWNAYVWCAAYSWCADVYKNDKNKYKALIEVYGGGKAAAETTMLGGKRYITKLTNGLVIVGDMSMAAFEIFSRKMGSQLSKASQAEIKKFEDQIKQDLKKLAALPDTEVRAATLVAGLVSGGAALASGGALVIIARMIVEIVLETPAIRSVMIKKLEDQLGVSIEKELASGSSSNPTIAYIVSQLPEQDRKALLAKFTKVGMATYIDVPKISGNIMKSMGGKLTGSTIFSKMVTEIVGATTTKCFKKDWSSKAGFMLIALSIGGHVQRMEQGSKELKKEHPKVYGWAKKHNLDLLWAYIKPHLPAAEAEIKNRYAHVPQNIAEEAAKKVVQAKVEAYLKEKYPKLYAAAQLAVKSHEGGKVLDAFGKRKDAIKAGADRGKKEVQERMQ